MIQRCSDAPGTRWIWPSVTISNTVASVGMGSWAARLALRMDNIEMRCIIGAGGPDIKAVSLTLLISDGNGTPTFSHGPSIGE